MPNPVFQSLAKQRIDAFCAAYRASRDLFYDEAEGRLRHSAEFGAYRERLCADFFRLFVPSYLSIGSGFLINGDAGISTQCDLVLFDHYHTPLVEDAERRRFFPVETVAAIAEVKSVLSKQALLEALVKLANAKKLRSKETIHPVRRTQSISHEEVGHHYDAMVSFLICEELTFDLTDITADVSKHYDAAGIAPDHRHNLVLSIKDGILCYKNHLLQRNVAWMYPFSRGEKMKNRFVFPGDNGRNHFGLFTAYLFHLTVNATIYLPEIRIYDTPPVMGMYQDEK